MKRINIELPEFTYGTREEVKTLRTNVQFCGDDKQVILFTSSLPGEGKTRNAIGRRGRQGAVSFPVRTVHHC